MSAKIRDRLIERGQKLFNASKQLNQFTKIHEPDALLNDLEEHAHAFVLACIMDRQVKAEKAWIIPYRFAQQLGEFSMATLQNLNRNAVASPRVQCRKPIPGCAQFRLPSECAWT